MGRAEANQLACRYPAENCFSGMDGQFSFQRAREHDASGATRIHPYTGEVQEQARYRTYRSGTRVAGQAGDVHSFDRVFVVAAAGGGRSGAVGIKHRGRDQISDHWINDFSYRDSVLLLD